MLPIGQYSAVANRCSLILNGESPRQFPAGGMIHSPAFRVWHAAKTAQNYDRPQEIHPPSKPATGPVLSTAIPDWRIRCSPALTAKAQISLILLADQPAPFKLFIVPTVIQPVPRAEVDTKWRCSHRSGILPDRYYLVTASQPNWESKIEYRDAVLFKWCARLRQERMTVFCPAKTAPRHFRVYGSPRCHRPQARISGTIAGRSRAEPVCPNQTSKTKRGFNPAEFQNPTRISMSGKEIFNHTRLCTRSQDIFPPIKSPLFLLGSMIKATLFFPPLNAVSRLTPL